MRFILSIRLQWPNLQMVHFSEVKIHIKNQPEGLQQKFPNFCTSTFLCAGSALCGIFVNLVFVQNLVDVVVLFLIVSRAMTYFHLLLVYKHNTTRLILNFNFNLIIMTTTLFLISWCFHNFNSTIR